MNLSLVLTVHDRDDRINRMVSRSFLPDGNHPDEIVVVLDRPTREATTSATQRYSALAEDIGADFRLVMIDGEQGWKCPAAAWNKGFEQSTGDFLYCISSDTIQSTEHNLSRAREIASIDSVIFGACVNSDDRVLHGHPPGTIVSSHKPNPNGFIAVIPREAVESIGGYDEAFMDGLMYEDADFFLRLWNSGLSFVFDDFIRGTHINHPRPVLYTDEGISLVERNVRLYLEKHLTVNAWDKIEKIEQHSNKQLRWCHR